MLPSGPRAVGTVRSAVACATRSGWLTVTVRRSPRRRAPSRRTTGGKSAGEYGAPVGQRARAASGCAAAAVVVANADQPSANRSLAVEAHGDDRGALGEGKVERGGEVVVPEARCERVARVDSIGADCQQAGAVGNTVREIAIAPGQCHACDAGSAPKGVVQGRVVAGNDVAAGRQDLAAEVGVIDVHAGVDHGNGLAVAVVSAAGGVEEGTRQAQSEHRARQRGDLSRQGLRTT